MAYERVNRFASVGRTVDQAQYDEGLRQHMLRVYNYVTAGLAISGGVAWLVLNTALGQVFGTPVTTAAGNVFLVPNMLGYIAMFAPLVMLLVGSFVIRNPSTSLLNGFFWTFVALKGVGLALVVQMYTGTSVARVFFITAATFAAMSIYGYTTKRDLSGFGSFLMMGLIGIIIAALVNFFLQSPALAFAISVIGVLVFVGLIAYDTQSIKESYAEHNGENVNQMIAIMGALSLYLNFINLFMLLLSLFGQSRE